MMRYVAVAIIALAIGHWAGFWFGRTLELYESAKRYGVIPQDMTWSEFLDSRKKKP